MPDKTPTLAQAALLVMRGQKAPALVLKEAHEAAATKAGADKKMPRYAVNFRLDKIARSAKGGYADRYDKLNTLIKVFGVKPWHYATSSWEISSHLLASTLKEHLSAPLDDKIDVLVVTPIGLSQVFGDPKKLES